jgi:hypothetical protein
MSGGLGFHGDLNAPPDTEDWALAMREEIRSSWSMAMLDVLMFRIHRMADVEGWRRLKNKQGRPFASLTEFLTEKPIEGIGMNVDKVSDVIAALKKPAEVVRVTQAAGAKVHPGPGRGKKRNASDALAFPNGKPVADTSIPLGSTSAARLAARIKRDASPEFVARVERGEFPSMRAAAIAAGVLKVPTTLELAQRAFAKLSPTEQAQFLFWVHQQDQRAA